MIAEPAVMKSNEEQQSAGKDEAKKSNVVVNLSGARLTPDPASSEGPAAKQPKAASQLLTDLHTRLIASVETDVLHRDIVNMSLDDAKKRGRAWFKARARATVSTPSLESSTLASPRAETTPQLSEDDFNKTFEIWSFVCSYEPLLRDSVERSLNLRGTVAYSDIVRSEPAVTLGVSLSEMESALRSLEPSPYLDALFVALIALAGSPEPVPRIPSDLASREGEAYDKIHGLLKRARRVPIVNLHFLNALTWPAILRDLIEYLIESVAATPPCDGESQYFRPQRETTTDTGDHVLNQAESSWSGIESKAEAAFSEDGVALMQLQEKSAIAELKWVEFLYTALVQLEEPTQDRIVELRDRAVHEMGAPRALLETVSRATLLDLCWQFATLKHPRARERFTERVRAMLRSLKEEKTACLAWDLVFYSAPKPDAHHGGEEHLTGAARRKAKAAALATEVEHKNPQPPVLSDFADFEAACLAGVHWGSPLALVVDARRVLTNVLKLTPSTDVREAATKLCRRVEEIVEFWFLAESPLALEEREDPPWGQWSNVVNLDPQDTISISPASLTGNGLITTTSPGFSSDLIQLSTRGAAREANMSMQSIDDLPSRPSDPKQQARIVEHLEALSRLVALREPRDMTVSQRLALLSVLVKECAASQAVRQYQEDQLLNLGPKGKGGRWVVRARNKRRAATIEEALRSSFLRNYESAWTGKSKPSSSTSNSAASYHVSPDDEMEVRELRETDSSPSSTSLPVERLRAPLAKLELDAFYTPSNCVACGLALSESNERQEIDPVFGWSFVHLPNGTVFCPPLEGQTSRAAHASCVATARHIASHRDKVLKEACSDLANKIQTAESYVSSRWKHGSARCLPFEMLNSLRVRDPHEHRGVFWAFPYDRAWVFVQDSAKRLTKVGVEEFREQRAAAQCDESELFILDVLSGIIIRGLNLPDVREQQHGVFPLVSLPPKAPNTSLQVVGSLTRASQLLDDVFVEERARTAWPTKSAHCALCVEVLTNDDEAHCSWCHTTFPTLSLAREHLLTCLASVDANRAGLAWAATGRAPAAGPGVAAWRNLSLIKRAMLDIEVASRMSAPMTKENAWSLSRRAAWVETVKTAVAPIQLSLAVEALETEVNLSRQPVGDQATAAANRPSKGSRVTGGGYEDDGEDESSMDSRADFEEPAETLDGYPVVTSKVRARQVKEQLELLAVSDYVSSEPRGRTVAEVMRRVLALDERLDYEVGLGDDDDLADL